MSFTLSEDRTLKLSLIDFLSEDVIILMHKKKPLGNTMAASEMLVFVYVNKNSDIIQQLGSRCFLFYGFFYP